MRELIRRIEEGKNLCIRKKLVFFLSLLLFYFLKKKHEKQNFFSRSQNFKIKRNFNFFFLSRKFYNRRNYQVCSGIGCLANCLSKFLPRSEHFCGPSSAHQVFSGVSLVCERFQKICQNQSLVPVRFLYINGENMKWGHQKVVKMSQILFYVMTFGNLDNVSTKIQRVI